MSQLAFGSSELGKAKLSCFHDSVDVDVASLPRTKDEWYEAIVCPVCRKKRAVVSVTYSTLSDSTAPLEP